MRKIINDPVHGFITIDHELIWRVMNHPYFQRLRRIKQMALAHLVYPGAVHTRFAHSIGAYHLMCKALDELQQRGISITAEEALGAKLAILLHDIGHGPFSHALESTLVNVHHESISLQVMHVLNREFDGALTTAIEIFTGETKKEFLHQLVSSQVDTDRLDYLARDSFYTGVSEGVIGYDRILKMLDVHNNHIVVEEKGLYSIEKFLVARRLMYWQVYLHKTVISSEQLLVHILKRAKEISEKGKSLFATPALQVFLQNNYDQESFQQNEILQAFLSLDDDDIMSAIKCWAAHEDKILSDLSSRLINRNLFKTVLSDIPSEELYEQKKQWLQEAYGLKEDEIKYYLYSDVLINQAYDSKEEEINIHCKDGSVCNIASIGHSLMAMANSKVKKYYLCFPRS